MWKSVLNIWGLQVKSLSISSVLCNVCSKSISSKFNTCRQFRREYPYYYLIYVDSFLKWFKPISVKGALQFLFKEQNVLGRSSGVSPTLHTTLSP